MEDTHKKHHHDTQVEESTGERAYEAATEVVVKNNEEENAKTQLLRITADFANYRRRVEKERVEWVSVGQNAVVKSFLPIIDDIERAFEAAKNTIITNESAQLQTIIEGLDLVDKNMRKVLSDLGVQEVACTGMFDPHVHEALMQTVVDGLEPGMIVQVLSKGYTYKGMVVRHAKVSVAA